MRYFDSITDFEQTKKRYRKLALQLHPDVGGSPSEFQQLQKEYQVVLLNLQQSKDIKTPNTNNEIVSELGKLAKSLLKTQIPQQYLKHRMDKSKTPLERNLYSGIIKFLNELQ
ncbi:MAG: J domain-containing protein [Bacteroidales bacterium]|nr:J domain-containing protein [Bacteroidales bacterium]